MRRLLVLALLLGSPALAHDYTVGGMKIEHPYGHPTPATARSAGGYLAITNTGITTDRLVSVRTDFPRTTLHETIFDGDVARMVEAPDGGFPIPAGETLMLAPGGKHVMFMGLSEPFTEGDKIEATLVFEQAGEIAVTFNIEPRKDGAHDDHSAHGGHMDHSGH